jgi:glucosylglycerol-phosphate synthase
VERLDYVKGIIQKAEAFENLLAANPELRGKVTLVLVATPPADGMEVYEETREAVEAVVGRVNGQFAPSIGHPSITSSKRCPTRT